jgi:glucokinase
MSQIIGIEIGGTKLQFVSADESGLIRERRKLQVESGQGAPGIRQQIQSVLPELLGSGRALATGIGFGGPVDWRTGKICRSHQIEGWSEFELGAWIGKLTGSPVIVDNDANVAALGEGTRGAGRGHDPVFYVTLGSGVGGGLVVGGSIYHGAVPGESEIGHIRLDRSGTTVESRCSGWAVDEQARRLISEAPESPLAKIAGGAGSTGGEARFVAAAISAGDAGAQRFLHQLAADLAFGLSHVVHLFHPTILIIGGGLSSIGEPLRVAVREALAGFVMEVFRPGPEVALAALKEDAVPVGAIEMARRKLSAGELP